MAGINSVLNRAKKKTTDTKKKTSVVQIELSEEMLGDIEKWKYVTKEKKDLESKQKEMSEPIRESMQAAREAHCLKTGEFTSSVACSGVMLSAQNAYSSLSEDDIANLKEKFGSNFEKYFKSETKVSLDVKNENLINKIADACEKRGIDLADVLTVEEIWKPTEVFHQLSVTDEDISKKFRVLVESGTLRPRTPSLK